MSETGDAVAFQRAVGHVEHEGTEPVDRARSFRHWEEFYKKNSRRPEGLPCGRIGIFDAMLNDMRALTSHTTGDGRPKLVTIVALDGWDDQPFSHLPPPGHGPRDAGRRAIVESAREREMRSNMSINSITPPRWVSSRRSGHTVVLGNAAFFRDLGLSIENLGDWPERLRQRGEQVLFVAVDGRTAGFLGVANAWSEQTRTSDAMEEEMRDAVSNADQFPTATADLPKAQSAELIELADGASVRPPYRAGDQAPRRRDGADARLQRVRFLARRFGCGKGPRSLVNVVNEGDLEATVHWHGLRLDNRYDGTLATQRPIPVGGTFTYQLTFPDPGVYWYHPHIREDYGQEMGLYGNIVVVPSEPDYWPPVNRELTLTLDDILLRTEGRAVQPVASDLHGDGPVRQRVAGERRAAACRLRARHGEVVRFYLTNTANTRVFNVGLRGARMKLVGGDSGRYERETFVESVVIAPSERVVVDVLFDQPGEVTLEHRTPDRTYPLAAITVAS